MLNRCCMHYVQGILTVQLQQDGGKRGHWRRHSVGMLQLLRPVLLVTPPHLAAEPLKKPATGRFRSPLALKASFGEHVTRAIEKESHGTLMRHFAPIIQQETIGNEHNRVGRRGRRGLPLLACYSGDCRVQATQEFLMQGAKTAAHQYTHTLRHHTR